MKVSYIFRSKKRNEFSIENVFRIIEKKVKIKFETENIYLPQIGYSNIKDLYENIKFTKKISTDIYHITGEINFLACVTPPQKTIITIHDYVNLENNKGLKKIISWIFWNYIPLKRCSYATCISKKVLDETVERFPKYKHKCILIPNPVDDDIEYKNKEFNKIKPRILVIGTRENKNLERIIKALEKINCVLDIIGKLSDDQKKMLQKYNVEYKNEFNLSNEEIRQKYYYCDIVCFPSLYEGFGLPIIEAQTIGRPVITSNIKPMIDIANDGACIVNPYDYLDIRKGILKVIDDDVFRNKIIKNGKENCKNYNSDIIAEKYCELYKNIISKKV